jgi:toxin HigB-1
MGTHESKPQDRNRRIVTLAVNHAMRYYRCRSSRSSANRAQRLDDLRVPPGNRLESLAGNRLGQWSIRINDQFRICFVWTDANAEEVEIVDYR